MSYREKVREILVKELSSREFQIDNDLLDYLIRAVISGTYAFQIIWDGSYRIINISHLDWRLIKFDSEGLVSIDGGKRFQWNVGEILYLNPGALRAWKINNILN
jgi:hypothetical protein